MRKKNSLIIILFLLLISIFYYSTNIEPNKLVIKEQSLYVPHWNKRLDGLKIAIISDIHAFYGKTTTSKLTQIVDETNKQNPDLILLLGDLDAVPISKSEQKQKDTSEILKNLTAKYGVISILGNHDFEPPQIVPTVLKNANITVLENKNKQININNQKLNIIGLKDLWHYKITPTEIENIINKETSPIIVLSHNPDVFPDIPDKVSLTLSGHTHGGEVYLPILGAPMVPSDYAQRFRKGYIIENNKHLFVTSGIGTLSGLRFLNPPEIVILHIYTQTDNNKISNTKELKGFHKNYIPFYLKIKNKIQGS